VVVVECSRSILQDLVADIIGPSRVCLGNEPFLPEAVHDGVGERGFDVEDAAELPIHNKLEFFPVFAEECMSRQRQYFSAEAMNELSRLPPGCAHLTEVDTLRLYFVCKVVLLRGDMRLLCQSSTESS
jgi:hypothetical protein